MPHLNYRPPESFKPHGQVTANQTPFDDATLYRMEYTPKHLEPCPASLLNTGLSKYVYDETVCLNLSLSYSSLSFGSYSFTDPLFILNIIE